MLFDTNKTVRKPARVLLIDDEPRLRDLLCDVIREMGFIPNAVRSAEEAIRVMETDPVGIIILDLQLPLMSGMVFFELVRKQWPETQVIIMTGFGDLQSAQQAIRLDVVDFVTKPFHLRDIEIALDRATRRVNLKHPSRVLLQREKTAAKTLAENEQQLILAALERCNGNRTAAAAELGISRRKLHYWLNDHADDSSDY